MAPTPPEDDMPTLVEQPTYNYTFSIADMSPVDTGNAARTWVTTHASSSSTAGGAGPGSGVFATSHLSPTQPPPSPPPVEPHHIPRPPNAFILFRASFIRDQKVLSTTEGNHGSLSKLIGMYWRALPASERRYWELQAEKAREEHRQKYTDWRFRPGNANKGLNAPASKGRGRVKERDKEKGGKGKGKARDTGDDDDFHAPSAKSSSPKGKGKRKAPARATKARKLSNALEPKPAATTASDDARLQKITSLLLAGKKADEIESEMLKWDGLAPVERTELVAPAPSSSTIPTEEPEASSSQLRTKRALSYDPYDEDPYAYLSPSPIDSPRSRSPAPPSEQCDTPVSPVRPPFEPDGRDDAGYMSAEAWSVGSVPLTRRFRRSTSAPPEPPGSPTSPLSPEDVGPSAPYYSFPSSSNSSAYDIGAATNLGDPSNGFRVTKRTRYTGHARTMSHVAIPTWQSLGGPQMSQPTQEWWSSSQSQWQASTVQESSFSSLSGWDGPPVHTPLHAQPTLVTTTAPPLVVAQPVPTLPAARSSPTLLRNNFQFDSVSVQAAPGATTRVAAGERPINDKDAGDVWARSPEWQNSIQPLGLGGGRGHSLVHDRSGASGSGRRG